MKGWEWGVTTPIGFSREKEELNKSRICCKIGRLTSHFWLKIKRNLKAVLLDKSETVKQPSASVKPLNQESERVGKIVCILGGIT